MDEQTPVALATPIQIPTYTLVAPETPSATQSLDPTTTPVPTPTPDTDEDVRNSTPPPEENETGSRFDSITTRQVVELLPDDVVACLINELGEVAYAEELDATFEDSALTESIFEGCFASEEAQYAWLVSLSLVTLFEEDGRLVEETSNCLVRLAASNTYVYGIFSGVHIASPTPEEYISGNIGILLCLKDEEAAVIGINSGGFPSPGELRCMNSDLESLEPLEMLYIWREPGTEAISDVAAAARECGVEHGPWGLRPETRMCVRPIWEANNGLSVTEIPPSLNELVLGALETILCYTDEESEAISEFSSSSGVDILPSQLACIQERLGSLDTLAKAMLGQEIDTETDMRLSQAANACNADLSLIRP